MFDNINYIFAVLGFFIGSGILIKIISLSYEIGKFRGVINQQINQIKEEIHTIKTNDIHSTKVIIDKIWKDVLELKEKIIKLETKVDNLYDNFDRYFNGKNK